MSSQSVSDLINKYEACMSSLSEYLKSNPVKPHSKQPKVSVAVKNHENVRKSRRLEEKAKRNPP
jgi:hypothetical protein